MSLEDTLDSKRLYTTPDMTIFNNDLRSSSMDEHSPLQDTLRSRSLWSTQFQDTEMHGLRTSFDNTSQMGSPQELSVFDQQNSWPLNDACSTTSQDPTSLASLSQNFDSVTYVPQGSDDSSSHVFFPSMDILPNASSQGHKQQEWQSSSVSHASLSPVPETTSVSNRTSRSVSGSSTGSKKDGIRKKNSRCHIPPQRNLNNIDMLISQSKNNGDIQMLKHEKRLLRNRKAALESRQRKKIYTEQLEEDNKQKNAIIQSMQQVLQHERSKVLEMQHNMQQYFEKVIRDKDQEISELQRGQLNSNPLSQSFADLDGPWDQGLTMTPTATVGSPSAHSASNPATPKMNTLPVSNVLAKKDDGMSFNRDTFYMCLLFGALIASQSSLLSATSSVPRLPDEYQSDSANLLKALLEGDDPVPPLTPSVDSVVSTAFCDAASSPTMATHDPLLTPSSQHQQQPGKANEQFFSLPTGGGGGGDEFRDYTTLGCDDDDDGHGLDPSSPVRLGPADGFAIDIGKSPGMQPPHGFDTTTTTTTTAAAALGGAGGGVFGGGFSHNNGYPDNNSNSHRARSMLGMLRSSRDLPEKVVRDFQEVVRHSGLAVGKISIPAA